MHRIPMLLNSPIFTWNRQQPECELFDQTLNQANVGENDNFLNVLDEQADRFRERSFGWAAHRLVVVQDLLETKEAESLGASVRMLNSIILRAPKEAPEVALSLRLRGNWYFKYSCFESASNDYLMFLYIRSSSATFEQFCEINGNLAICLFLMGQYSKARKYVRTYLKNKAKLPNTLGNPQFDKIDQHLSQFGEEFDSIDTRAKRNCIIMPFKGFNKNGDIPFGSSACQVKKSKEETQTAGVYAISEIPYGSVVLAENPVNHSINMPFIQCELCFRRRDQVYTCLECRYKTYCSVDCLENDKAMHEIECVGYRTLLLLILDATNLFRTFVRVSMLLHEQVFSLKVFRKLTKAGIIFNTMEQILKENESHKCQFLQLLYFKPNYLLLSKMQYATLVTIAFRVTFFIEKKTSILNSFYRRLHISSKQKLTLVGAILMRLGCRLLIDSFDLEHIFPLQEERPQATTLNSQIEDAASCIPAMRDSNVNNIEKYYSLEDEEMNQHYDHLMHQLQSAEIITPLSLPSFTHTKPCNSIIRPLSIYKDNIAEVYFNPDAAEFFIYGEAFDVPEVKIAASMLCARITSLSSWERIQLVQGFAWLFHTHIEESFMQFSLRFNYVRQTLTLLCPTLSKFRHSCVPNVQIVVLESGLVVGKALCDIKEGEEMTLSYKANSMRHSRDERKMFLERLGIECNCKCCTMPRLAEPTNLRLAIYCDRCENKEITPDDGKCSNCCITYNNLLIKYRTELMIIQNAITNKLKPNVDGREMYILYRMSYLHARKHFSPSNEFRICVELNYAQYLALRNFAQQAYDIVMDIRSLLLDNYAEYDIWFTLYVNILLVIKIILYYNVDKGLRFLSTADLLNLCEYGSYIVLGQKKHVVLNEAFDTECTQIIEDTHKFSVWRREIIDKDKQ